MLKLSRLLTSVVFVVSWMSIQCMVCGCASSQSLQPPKSKINLPVATEKTVRLEFDPERPRTAVLIEPLKTALEAKGYRVVGKNDPASYHVRLSLLVFDLMSDLKNARREAGPGEAVSTAGLAAAANATSALGVAGGIAGMVLGEFLKSPRPDRWWAGEVEVAVAGPDQILQKDKISGHSYNERLDTSKPEGREKLAQASIAFMVRQIAAIFPD